MLDTFVAQLILQERQIAYAIADRALRLQQIGGRLDLIESAGAYTVVGASLLDLARELIGYEDQLQALLSGTLASFQVALVNRENGAGELFYVTLHNYAYHGDNGEVTGILHIIENVTSMGENNQVLTQQRNEIFLLYEQLRRANLKLEAANAELRALDALKSKFVSIAAHELRTPLASILGYIDFILNDPLRALHADHQTSVDVIGKSATRLLAITNNLLDVTRIEAGYMELTLASVDLAKVVEEVAIHLRPEFEQKQHTFSLEKEPKLPHAFCDEARTMQIFSNLLSNAIKYTPAHGRITVNLHHAPTQDVIIATVTDTGIGIPAGDLQNIGKNFFRASNVHLSRANGTGLGLNITHSLVELQGGRMWIESTLGAGSIFYLTFPIDDGITPA